MTRHGAHLRGQAAADEALRAAVEQVRDLREEGLRISTPADLPDAVQVLQQCLTHAAMLKSIREMFERGVGSRGSHCILDPDGIEMHPRLRDPDTAEPYRFRLENEALRDTILLTAYDPRADDLFTCRDIQPRPIPDRQIAFEPAWTEYREGKIYEV